MNVGVRSQQADHASLALAHAGNPQPTLTFNLSLQDHHQLQITQRRSIFTRERKLSARQSEAMGKRMRMMTMYWRSQYPRHRLGLGVGLVLGLGLASGLAAGMPAPTQTAPDQAAAARAMDPVLTLAFKVKPADRPAFQKLMTDIQATRLRKWKEHGLLAGYRLLASRYADDGQWDVMEILDFRDDAALARWNSLESNSVGGLSAGALALVQSVTTTPVGRVDAGGSRTASDSAVLVVPYVAHVSADEYQSYLDGYTIPQFKGWIAQGILDSYDVLTSIYPAGRPWTTLIVLRYRNDAALARREQVKAKVRADLTTDAAWMAFSKNKKDIRAEGVATLADELAASEVAP